MIYRKMERLGVTPSLLGFGCMRLPLTPEKTIDEAETMRMFDLAYNAGVTYYDTAYPYHNGESELVVGKMLKRYPRDSYYIATKLPMYMITSLEQAKEIFEEQRKKLQMECIDFYLLHTLNKNSFDLAVREGIIDYCEQLKKEGKIRFLGFSFHDEYEQFERILTYRDWDFCQIQYNYRDEAFQAGTKGYELAKSLNIPVIVMEPVRGGQLANLAEDISAPMREATPGASDASFALRWAAGHDGVNVILSGMSTYEQMEDNLKTFESEKPLSEKEQEAIAEVSRRLDKLVRIGCTACRYCMPCPAGVDIPGNFSVWNNLGMYGKSHSVEFAWKMQIKDENRADQCVQCHQCEEKCPQNLPIADALQQLQQELDAAYPRT